MTGAAVRWAGAWRTAAWVEALMARLAQHRLTRSVLVVEDNVDLLTSTVLILRSSLGVPVYGAGTARAGIALWHAYRCKVVIADLMLGPTDDGVALLNACGREVRAVLVSGAVDMDLLRVASERCRPDIILTKPIGDIAAVARELLGDNH